MRREQFDNKFRNQNLSQAELDRKWRVMREQEEMQRLFEEQQFRARTMTSTFTGGAGDVNQFTPFILQSFDDWSLGRLKTDGTVTPLENDPHFPGKTVFSKNTKNGLTYFVTQSSETLNTEFGYWNQETGEIYVFEDASNDLRSETPASLQYIEGNDIYGGNFFIYLDCYALFSDGEQGPVLFKIQLDGDGAIVTTLAEWENPISLGAGPVSAYYTLPVPVGASPTPALYRIEIVGSGNPLAYPQLIDGETFLPIETYSIMSIDGEDIFNSKPVYVLDRTDYEGEIYFNVFCWNKIENFPFIVIAKWDKIDPSNLTTVHRYNLDILYLGLTTI